MKTILVLSLFICFLTACKQKPSDVVEVTPSASASSAQPANQPYPVAEQPAPQPASPAPPPASEVEAPAAPAPQRVFEPRRPVPVNRRSPLAARPLASAPKYSASLPPRRDTPMYPHQPDTLVIPQGATVRVRLDETLDTRHNRSGDPFRATLISPIDVDGVTVIPRGTRFMGFLVESRPSGRFKGTAVLSLSLDSFELDGQTYHVRTSRAVRYHGGHKKGNWIEIGGGAGTGAAFGIIGGPPGVLIGAGVGAAAGSTVRAITGRKNVRLPVETALSFTLRAPATVAEYRSSASAAEQLQ